jgi:hypothetical protein
MVRKTVRKREREGSSDDGHTVREIEWKGNRK